ncbi:MAG: hypothetical protein M3474_05370 [Actinomycetota bacterium]|nr:hypothetical protein [Actinomycetota bacterium]
MTTPTRNSEGATATDPPAPSDDATDATDTAQGAPDGAEEAPEGDDARPGAEAARYRRRLRETETERDGLVEQLDGFRRREAERVAAGALSKPSDIWLDGRDIGDLLDDAGQVDPAKVNAEVASVLDGRPQLAATRQRPKPDDAQGRPMVRSSEGWVDVLKGRKP